MTTFLCALSFLSALIGGAFGALVLSRVMKRIEVTLAFTLRQHPVCSHCGSELDVRTFVEGVEQRD